MIENAKTKVNTYHLVSEGGKARGDLHIRNASLRNFHTFIDLHVKNGLNIVPVIGVDFSLANLTFDEKQQCIHTLKEGAPNDYVDVLRRVNSAFKYFSQFMLGYGVGARTVDGEGPACNLFSMTGDFQDPFIHNEEELINSYSGTIRAVKLGLPVKFQNIIKVVCDFAQTEYGTASDPKYIKNYYVLILLMAGMIDDIEDSVNEILRAANLPMSVVIIKIGNVQQENDSTNLIEKAMRTFNECERKFIDIMNYDQYKNAAGQITTILQQQFEYDLIKDIPKHIEKFFEMQKFEMEVQIDSPRASSDGMNSPTKAYTSA